MMSNSRVELCPDAGELADPHQLLVVLGGAAVLQSVLGTSGVRPGHGHHADRGPCVLCGCLVEGQAQMDLQARR